jgi:hypothetical protein
MCYYTYELDNESSDLCVIVTPYGKFKYLRLPMGVKQSLNFAQEIIEEVLQGLDECEAYIDDVVGTFNDSWEAHLKSLDHVPKRLEKNGATHSNANGRSKKPIGSVTGSPQLV